MTGMLHSQRAKSREDVATCESLEPSHGPGNLAGRDDVSTDIGNFGNSDSSHCWVTGQRGCRSELDHVRGSHAVIGTGCTVPVGKRKHGPLGTRYTRSALCWRNSYRKQVANM